MNKLLLPVVLVAFSFGNAVMASGESPQESDHSTVKLFFVNVTPPESDALDGKKEIAHAGGLVLPASAVRPASIHIDDEFVGHAMFGHVDVEPTFRLPSGVHKFRVECEGYETFSSAMKVLGAGSEQWLVVRMRPGEPKTTKAASQTPDRSTVTEFLSAFADTTGDLDIERARSLFLPVDDSPEGQARARHIQELQKDWSRAKAKGESVAVSFGDPETRKLDAERQRITIEADMRLRESEGSDSDAVPVEFTLQRTEDGLKIVSFDTLRSP